MQTGADHLREPPKKSNSDGFPLKSPRITYFMFDKKSQIKNNLSVNVSTFCFYRYKQARKKFRGNKFYSASANFANCLKIVY